MISASIISSAGVRNFPTLSTTLLGVSTKKSVMAKKIKELSAEIGEATTNSSDTKVSIETPTPKDNRTKEKSER